MREHCTVALSIEDVKAFVNSGPLDILQGDRRSDAMAQRTGVAVECDGTTAGRATPMKAIIL
jgi:hypothetical protein